MDKNSGYFGYDNLAFDSEVDAGEYCRKAAGLYELYQTCANRKQIETICLNFLRTLDATKLSVNGHLYFIPQYRMERVDVFEDFIAAVAKLNQTDNPLIANSIYVIDDAKQRDKMTEEFYAAVKKEISEYQERADYLIKSGCCSPAILERWVLKIASLEDKKRHYENILRRAERAGRRVHRPQGLLAGACHPCTGHPRAKGGIRKGIYEQRRCGKKSHAAVFLHSTTK